MSHDDEQGAQVARDAGAGLSDHPQPVYTAPPTLDKALADLPLIEMALGRESNQVDRAEVHADGIAL